ncbi:hypothetical protein K435DRAFT_860409 [Dendrothele bispora CBS 962.96]|uniref:Uncharacterized protein n=1 Tax=Dendrothele bispora (strain CBS 962.96) TaxID=1314807 RepID=A0A4S8LY26_DENBC|nr:hypothetical protein K435DRAFT_860409 [Dendrothele bispora CBS 962.96]
MTITQQHLRQQLYIFVLLIVRLDGHSTKNSPIRELIPEPHPKASAPVGSTTITSGTASALLFAF